MKMRTVNLRLPEDVFNAVGELAKKKGLTKSSLIRVIVVEYLEKQKKEGVKNG